MSDAPNENTIKVGISDDCEVIIRLPRMMRADEENNLVFTIKQALDFANTITAQATKAINELDKRAKIGLN